MKKKKEKANRNTEAKAETETEAEEKKTAPEGVEVIEDENTRTVITRDKSGRIRQQIASLKY